MIYTGFAIGVPALVVFAAKMVEMFPPTQNAVIPGYLKNCVIPPGTPYMVWIGAVNILLFSASLVFALLTFRSLWRAHHHAQILTKSKSQSILLSNKITLLQDFD
ncbi:unnamed protein product [Allacma fusca]|uniref:Uncharacterized protein n=1 Tax=Allacma fusca TaxID=39272 RepID=A0A8J2KXE2_9HEXA|nr:unnamed protein product [Allacma fusca]